MRARRSAAGAGRHAASASGSAGARARATARPPARAHKGSRRAPAAARRGGFEGGQMPLYRRLPKRGFLPYGGKTRVRRGQPQGSLRPASPPAAWWIPTASREAGLIKKSGRGRGEDPGRRRGRRTPSRCARTRISEAARAEDRGGAAAGSRCWRSRSRWPLRDREPAELPEHLQDSGAQAPGPDHAGAARRLPARAPTCRPRASTATRSPQFFDQVQGTLLGMVDLFSGGNLRRLTDLRAGHHAVHLGLDHPAAARRWSSRPSSGWPRRARRGRRRSRSTPATARSCCRWSSRSASPCGLESMRSPSGAVDRARPGLGLPAADHDHADRRAPR